ncbi:deoxyribonuclease IV [Crassaminicella thermophila]|uniref:Probable endonuclease 4 n=1 Tax=Crassaminicella thermophila TaxID=2599308 RepID=A0A5C0SC86_CRATE|nr:deoxyribonuclease IV [Crassaminicella thermophila]QEK11781.1 deoxyribonuclease IV [Crassaminicella thermophila]
MLNIGSHLSVSKGYENMGKVALKMGANTFQFFTRNPRGGSAKELDLEDIKKLKKLMEENNFAPILAHAPYTLNMASYKEDTWNFAKRAFADDLKRLEIIPCSLYNFHPGNHTGKGVEYGIERIATVLNEIMTGNESTMVLLETMSGKGTEIGATFEELRMIIDKVKYSELIGITLDTCHVFSAGYDIVNNLDGVLEEFDKILGLDRLKAIHLNDSMTELGSRKDRHAGIGEGKIGLEAIINIIHHPVLKDLPFFLETPYDVEGHQREIELLKMY